VSPEDQLILALSGSDCSAACLKKAGDLIDRYGASIDYRRVLKLANMNGVSPLLYRNISTLQGIPDLVLGELRSAYLFTLKENSRKSAEVMRILSSLNTSGIEAIPLKGPVASDIIFGDPGLYPSGDIDILVRPADLERTRQVLRQEGYGDSATNPDDMLRSDYHLVLEKERSVVEVHWKLTFRYFEIPPEFWWEDVRTVSYQDSEVLALSPERYLLYAIFRLYRHAFRPLRFLVLAAGLIERYREELDWERLLSFADTFRMSRLVVFSLTLLQELLGVDIPASATGRRLFAYRQLRRLVVSGLFQEVGMIHPRMLLFTALQQTPQDMIRILSRRLFPSLSEIRIRYRLPAKSKKVYGYYLLNPFLMMVRKRG
jgi:hypothetical protein